MIDLRETWLPQMRAHARLVSDDEIIRAAWIDGDRTRTSVIGFSELLAQVFDDSDGEAMLEIAEREIEDRQLLHCLREFIQALSAAGNALGVEVGPENVLASSQWHAIRLAAAQLNACAE